MAFLIYPSKKSFACTAMEQWLIISSVFSVFLLMLRIEITDNLAFVFLPWNLFLALVPYLITRWLTLKPIIATGKWKFAMIFTIWLLFIPNSFYIMTDLFHLKFREESSRWFDLTLILSFAWSGMLFGILSVRQMEKIVANRFLSIGRLLFLFPVMWLIALGIYIGRFMRFNSWDIIANPFQLIEDIGFIVFNPREHIDIWGMISCFAIFMTIIYISIKRLAKVI